MIEARVPFLKKDTSYVYDIVDQYIELREGVVRIGYPSTINNFLRWGYYILDILSHSSEIEVFNKVFKILEPFNWEYARYINEDINFLSTIAKTEENEKLISKYYNRIFSYDLSKDRIQAKQHYSYLLFNTYGNKNKSIDLLNEAISEAKLIYDQDLELTLLIELGYSYKNNRLFEEAKRVFKQAISLAEYLENDHSIAMIYSTFFDLLVEGDRSYYDHAKHYLTISNRLINSKIYTCLKYNLLRTFKLFFFSPANL